MYNVKYVSIKVSLWRILVYLVCPQHLTCPIRKWRSCTQFFFSSLICHILFFWGRLIQIRGLVFAANRSESGDMDSNPAGCWNSLLLPCRFAWHWERQWTEIARLYIAVLSIILFSWILSAAISRWKGFNSQPEHPTSTVLEHLESGQGPNSAACVGLAHRQWL